ncbi:hypothetical protein V1283_005879 [Bradyrhizobium sp. AZCC 2262]|uniref:hypothetical protein n=1 Tax=Bradyrhizobium sp. AZCC 2262 TaxID=3117022 RepID=UPI002FF40DB9
MLFNNHGAFHVAQNFRDFDKYGDRNHVALSVAQRNAGRISSVNSRGGSSCTYNVIIDSIAVPLTGNPGEPAFKNTLGAGDRNTLALAFFFASLDRDAHLAQKIVVIDDPMTSLDESRSLTTVQELRRQGGASYRALPLATLFMHCVGEG